jgi:TonB family protein
MPDPTQSPENHPGAGVEKLDGLGESARFMTQAAGGQKFMSIRVLKLQSVINLQLMTTTGEFLPGRKPVLIEAMKLVLSRIGQDVPVAAEAAQAPASSQVASTTEAPKKVNIPGRAAAGMLLHRTLPVYPPEAKAAGVSGIVILQGTISKTGAIEDLRVITGPPMLRQSAIDAVKTWVYRPYLLNGNPTEVQTTVNVSFALEGTAPSGLPAAQAQAAASKDAPTSPRQGNTLTKEQAAALEASLAQTPDDLEIRAQLLAYYFSPVSQPIGTDARIQARRRHILWLIRNHPDSALLMESEASLDPSGQSLSDREGYGLAKRAWLDQTSKPGASAAVLGNAGRFFLLHDQALAVKFLKSARAQDPQNPLRVAMLGMAMADAIAGITMMNQNGFPGPADVEEANSDFAKSTWQELLTTNDATLIEIAASELMGRGTMAQNMAKAVAKNSAPNQPVAAPAVDVSALAESLFKRAEELDPSNRGINAALAKTYQLRAMTSTSEEEKKELTHARFEQILKSTSGLSVDDPVNSGQFLELERASLDAGELDRAASLAKGLLATVAKVKADAKDVDVGGITHESYLILGRVSLRRGDLAAAKADLLDAGRVSGGWTLSSFGPNMSLAKELLEMGEKDTVLEYLDLCRKFWSNGAKKSLDPWSEQIRNGQIPEFGANLIY